MAKKARVTKTLKPPAFKSGFAILDVKSGRKALLKHLKTTGKVLANIDVIIEYDHSGDDGISIEFACDVQAIRATRTLPPPYSR